MTKWGCIGNSSHRSECRTATPSSAGDTLPARLQPSLRLRCAPLEWVLDGQLLRPTPDWDGPNLPKGSCKHAYWAGGKEGRPPSRPESRYHVRPRLGACLRSGFAESTLPKAWNALIAGIEAKQARRSPRQGGALIQSKPGSAAVPHHGRRPTGGNGRGSSPKGDRGSECRRPRAPYVPSGSPPATLMWGTSDRSCQ